MKRETDYEIEHGMEENGLSEEEKRKVRSEVRARAIKATGLNPYLIVWEKMRPVQAFFGKYWRYFAPVGVVIVLVCIARLLYLYKMDMDSARNMERLQSVYQPIEVSEQVLASVRDALPEADPDIGPPLTERVKANISLHLENADCVGWLSIADTQIDYPVMYTEGDNDFYLSHNFDGEYDRNGLLVLDMRCDKSAEGNNILIHGHHMKSGMMFGGLKYYKEYDYFLEHPQIHLSTLRIERTYDIMAVFVSSVNDDDKESFKYYNYIDIEDEDTFYDYVQRIGEESFYDTGIDAVYGDRLITLSTCDYTRAEGRLVIVGREHRDGEE